MVLLLWIFVIYNKNLWILAFAACLLLGEVATVMMLLIRSVDFQGLPSHSFRKYALHSTILSQGTSNTGHHILPECTRARILSHVLDPNSCLPLYHLWFILVQGVFGLCPWWTSKFPGWRVAREDLPRFIGQLFIVSVHLA